MSDWRLIISPSSSGAANMQLDLELFRDLEEGHIPSTLRIYSWKPKCISLGYSQKIEKLIDEKKVKTLGWNIVKRPTGGGIVFHNEAEVTYSLVTAINNPLLPRGLVPSYGKISEAIIYGLGVLGVKAEIQSQNPHPYPLSLRERGKRGEGLCFSYPAEYEIIVSDKKIVGSAQKRGKKALLQQGSIFVRRTAAEAFSVLRQEYDKIDAVSVEEVLGRETNFEEMSKALVEGFRKVLDVKFYGN